MQRPAFVFAVFVTSVGLFVWSVASDTAGRSTSARPSDPSNSNVAAELPSARIPQVLRDPTPVLDRAQVIVSFVGTSQPRPSVATTAPVKPGATAWEALQEGVGVANLQFKDFGGSLGIAITGLYGVSAEGNHFWEFFVNGKSSDVGVSSYIVKAGDTLEFRYSSF